MRYIDLPRTIDRCRPEPPLTQLHNDCGQQDRCARRLAAIIDGARQRDFSKGCPPFGSTVLCTNFLPADGNAP